MREGREGGRPGGCQNFRTRIWSAGGREGGKEEWQHSYPLPKGLSTRGDVLHLQGPHVVVDEALRLVALVSAALGRDGGFDLKGGRGGGSEK